MTDISGLIHPEVRARALDCARVLGLERAEVRVIAADITLPLETQGGQVCEVIPNPCLDLYLEAVSTRPIAETFLETLFRPGETGRIPIAAISGTNGKTTVTRLVAHGLAVSGTLRRHDLHGWHLSRPIGGSTPTTAADPRARAWCS